MNSPYASPTAQVSDRPNRFSLGRALLAYLIAVATLAALMVGLGFLLTGQVPTAGGYGLLWSIALISSVAVGALGGHLARTSWLGATVVGIIGGVLLLVLIAAAAYVWGRLVRAV